MTIGPMSGEKLSIILAIGLEQRGMEGEEDVHVIREVEGVCGRIKSGLYDTLWAVVLNHELCNMMSQQQWKVLSNMSSPTVWTTSGE